MIKIAHKTPAVTAKSSGRMLTSWGLCHCATAAKKIYVFAGKDSWITHDSKPKAVDVSEATEQPTLISLTRSSLLLPLTLSTYVHVSSPGEASAWTSQHGKRRFSPPHNVHVSSPQLPSFGSLNLNGSFTIAFHFNNMSSPTPSSKIPKSAPKQHSFSEVPLVNCSPSALRASTLGDVGSGTSSFTSHSSPAPPRPVRAAGRGARCVRLVAGRAGQGGLGGRHREEEGGDITKSIEGAATEIFSLFSRYCF